MSEFQIQVNRIDPQVQKLQSCEKKVSGIAADVRSLSGRLSIEGESREILRTRLLKIADDIDDRSDDDRDDFDDHDDHDDDLDDDHDDYDDRDDYDDDDHDDRDDD